VRAGSACSSARTEGESGCVYYMACEDVVLASGCDGRCLRLGRLGTASLACGLIGAGDTSGEGAEGWKCGVGLAYQFSVDFGCMGARRVVCVSVPVYLIFRVAFS